MNRNTYAFGGFLHLKRSAFETVFFGVAGLAVALIIIRQWPTWADGLSTLLSIVSAIIFTVISYFVSAWKRVSPYLEFVERLRSEKINIPSTLVPASAKAVSIAVTENDDARSILEVLGGATDKARVNALRRSAVNSILQAGSFSSNHARSVIAITRSPKLPDKKAEFIETFAGSAVDPDYANDIYLTWLLAAKDGIHQGVTSLIGDDGAYPLWEVTDLRKPGELRKRVTDICLHLARTAVGACTKDRNKTFFATETIPPSKLGPFAEEGHFREELSDILKKHGIEDSLRVLIISRHNLKEEVVGGAVSDHMRDYIKWHEKSGAKLKVLVYAGNDAPEKSINLKTAPQFLNFAVFGESFIFAQNTGSKRAVIYDLSKYRHPTSKFKDFIRDVSEQYGHPKKLSDGLLLSEPITNDSDFLDFVAAVDLKLDAGASEASVSSVQPEEEAHWERCVFPKEACPVAQAS